MPDPEKVAIVVAEWVVKAENDLKAATINLRAGKECPADTVCFHAQQVVEKYLKALLTTRGIPFPKTHNIRKLVEIFPANRTLNLSRDEQDKLTDYATVTRYPGDYEPVTLAEARRAVSQARRVRKQVRSLLPKGALRRRKR